MTSDPREQRAREVALAIVDRFQNMPEHTAERLAEQITRALLAERRAGMEEAAKVHPTEAMARAMQGFNAIAGLRDEPWETISTDEQARWFSLAEMALIPVAAAIRALAAGKEGT